MVIISRQMAAIAWKMLLCEHCFINRPYDEVSGVKTFVSPKEDIILPPHFSSNYVNHVLIIPRKTFNGTDRIVRFSLIMVVPALDTHLLC